MMAIMMMMMTRIFLFINIKNSILESEIFFFICLLFSIDFSQWILSAAFFWNFEISKLFKVSMAVCSILLLLLIIIDNHQKNFFFEHTLQQQIINKTGSIPINHENISILYMLRLTNKLADGVYHHQWTEIEIRLTDERKRKKNSSHSYTFFFFFGNSAHSKMNSKLVNWKIFKNHYHHHHCPLVQDKSGHIQLSHHHHHHYYGK